MRKILAAILVMLTVSSARAVYKDDFRLVDSSKVHNDMWIQIRLAGRPFFFSSWVDRNIDPAWIGFVQKFDSVGTRPESGSARMSQSDAIR